MSDKKVEIDGLRFRIDDVYFVFSMDECLELYNQLSDIFGDKVQTFNFMGLEGVFPDLTGKPRYEDTLTEGGAGIQAPDEDAAEE
jgi:hypothetical protein